MTKLLLAIGLVFSGFAAASVYAAPAGAPVSILREGAPISVSFSGTLQSAPTALGPWKPLTNALSPWKEAATGSQKFFRTQSLPVQSLFASTTVVDLVVTGPLQHYFGLAFAGTPDGIFPPVREKPYFDAAVIISGLDVPVSMRVRGNSSLQECPFPKLKFKITPEHRAGTPFFEAREVKIGTHCAEGGHGNIGRLRDERAAFREAFVYELMGLMGFVAPRVRRAQVEYRDTTPDTEEGGWKLTRHAFLLDDIEVVAERLGGRALSDQEIAVLTNAGFDEELITELKLFHALVGNWDFAVSPGGEGLRNTDVIEVANGQLLPVAGDFDLASLVTGVVRSSAPRDYRPDLGDVEREALYRVEQLRGTESAQLFSEARTRFLEERPAIEALIDSAGVDDEGRTNAVRHVAAFFTALNLVVR